MDEGSRQDRRVLSPPVVGITLAVFSAAVAAASCFFVADPRVGVVAAIILTFGCVGAAAGLVLTRRKSWADRSWPPNSESKPWSARRTRRASLLYGVFLLAMSLLVTAASVWTDRRGTDDVTRGWVLVVALALLGIWSVVRGTRRLPETVRSSDRPVPEEIDEGDEWVRLGPQHPRGLFAWWAPLAFSGQPYLIAAVLGSFFPLTALQLGAGIWLLLAVGLMAAVVIVVLLRRRSLPPSISRDATRMLVGKTEFSAADIASVMAVASPWEPDATARSLAIVLATSGKARAVVTLRERGHLTLTADQTRLLIEAIEFSQTDLPHDKEDPGGRFSRTLYPNYLTKADAVEIVRQPPGDGDLLPFGPPSA